MTLYLKYRSQRISELDIKSVREMLGKLIRPGKLPHALLFCGSRGTGKTSAARILAKAVNCTNKKSKSQVPNSNDFEPCNECEMCLAITEGRATDVVEIDAASNRGIDEIRELREKVRLAPMQAKIKVYIIDEVHMLTIEAANALLKTLEEPPANTVFVLCTTDPQKLPETVVSRCMVVRFPKPTVDEIVQKLKFVVKQEKLEVSDLEVIAKSAKGSFRDAIKMLEQVALSGQKVDEVMGPEEFFEYVNISSSDALDFINKLVVHGVEMRTFVEKCVEYLREKMLVSKLPKIEIGLIEGLEKVYEQMRTTSIAQLPLEIWILQNTITHKQESPIIPKVEKVEAVVHQGEANLGELEKKWGEIMKQIKPLNHSIEALLRSTKPVAWDGERMTLGVFYKFHKDKLESEKCRILVEKTAASALEVAVVKLKLILVDKKVSDNIVGSVDDDIVAAAAEIFKAEVI